MSVDNFLPYDLVLTTSHHKRSFLEAGSIFNYKTAEERGGLVYIKASLILYQNQDWTCYVRYDTSTGNGVIKCNFKTKDGKSLILGLRLESHHNESRFLSLAFFCPLVVTNTTKFDFFYQQYTLENSRPKTIRHQKGEEAVLMDFDTFDVDVWIDDEWYGFIGWLSLTTKKQVPYVENGIARLLRFETIRDMEDRPVKGTTKIYIRDEMDQSRIERKDSWIKF